MKFLDSVISDGGDDIRMVFEVSLFLLTFIL